MDDITIDFRRFENCIWCVLITMTTVGYGDYYPRTFFGRIMTIMVAIWGSFMLSILVLVLTSSIECKNVTIINYISKYS